MNRDYLIFDIRRTLRNRRVLIFSILMPLVLFVIFGTTIPKDANEAGISAIAYVMVSMAMFGSMSAAMSSGGVIAAERDGGWNRTLRLTPLKPQAYVVNKVILSLLLAIPPLLVVFISGMTFGHVHLSMNQWATVALVSWLGALPFAALGLVIGYVAKPDSVQPITGLSTMLIAAFGGLWLPVEPDAVGDEAHRPADPGVLDQSDLTQRADAERPGHPRAAGGARLDRRPRLHRPPPVPRRHRAGLSAGAHRGALP